MSQTKLLHREMSQKRMNKVREFREARMLTKAELARKADVSALTIDRIEKGKPCRLDTQRKIVYALGLKPSDRVRVFGQEDESL